VAFGGFNQQIQGHQDMHETNPEHPDRVKTLTAEIDALQAQLDAMEQGTVAAAVLQTHINERKIDLSAAIAAANRLDPSDDAN
jgi:hypothetical protein